jgi:hypothetical protein
MRIADRKRSRLRIFSIKRILLSIVLGFLVPFSYALGLSLFGDYTGTVVPQSLVYPFGWPRPLWIFLMGRQPLESDIIGGIVFLTICNIALYGTLSYLALSGLQLLRHKPADPDLPPSPQLSS